MIRKKSGFKSWTPDLTRHSFASYSFAINRDADRLRRELGHVDQRMLKHYMQVSPKVDKDAKHYFGLSPEVVLGAKESNIISIQVSK